MESYFISTQDKIAHFDDKICTILSIWNTWRSGPFNYTSNTSCDTSTSDKVSEVPQLLAGAFRW